MKQQENKAWLASHLYYAEPWEEFLVKAVKPFVEEVISNGFAEQYFFIRYWEKGPHIRLRFKGNKVVLQTKLKPYLEQFFSTYYYEYPSQRDKDIWGKSQDLFPNNSIKFVEYEPEIARYGGEVGLFISEKHFEDSSRVVLSVLNESESWNYEKALGVAIQMHLAFAYGLGLNIGDVIQFFQINFENWFPRAYFPYGINLKADEIENRKQETLKAFEEKLDQQKAVLLPFIKVVWNALEEGVDFEQEYMNFWVESASQTSKEMKNAHEKGLLQVPPYNSSLYDLAPEQEPWRIYESYFHMINNRLGIFN
ncbi:lantibiotic dehydratase C-terminal domain-containing protein, partial [Xanthovirga aplysinae]|uniref:lantibiotic dehydratase C-terminal domain-containing protein n=1 Tax=Xanthovirga aplysinae TaxID=2529853 RepID=UPI0012BB86E7|nr:hypothetical protein [Xanthovirga aplysinae]